MQRVLSTSCCITMSGCISNQQTSVSLWFIRDWSHASFCLIFEGNYHSLTCQFRTEGKRNHMLLIARMMFFLALISNEYLTQNFIQYCLHWRSEIVAWTQPYPQLQASIPLVRLNLKPDGFEGVLIRMWFLVFPQAFLAYFSMSLWAVEHASRHPSVHLSGIRCSLLTTSVVAHFSCLSECVWVDSMFWYGKAHFLRLHLLTCKS